MWFESSELWSCVAAGKDLVTDLSQYDSSVITGRDWSRDDGWWTLMSEDMEIVRGEVVR